MAPHLPFVAEGPKFLFESLFPHPTIFAIATIQQDFQGRTMKLCFVLLFRGVRAIFGFRKDHESHLSSFARPSLKKNPFQPIT